MVSSFATKRPRHNTMLVLHLSRRSTSHSPFNITNVQTITRGHWEQSRSLRLILDLGGALPPADLPRIRVDLTDTWGTVTAEVEWWRRVFEPIEETGWVDGTAYRIAIACPPRGFPLSEPVAVTVALGEIRFRVGGEVNWVNQGPIRGALERCNPELRQLDRSRSPISTWRQRPPHEQPWERRSWVTSDLAYTDTAGFHHIRWDHDWDGSNTNGGNSGSYTTGMAATMGPRLGWQQLYWDDRPWQLMQWPHIWGQPEARENEETCDNTVRGNER